MGTIILVCKCRRTFQDERYGTYKRVHNVGPKDQQGRCPARRTVCGDVKLTTECK